MSDRSRLRLVARALLKLDPGRGERQAVLALLQCCYCGRVRSYDGEAALAALGKLTDEEERALVAHAVRHW